VTDCACASPFEISNRENEWNGGMNERKRLMEEFHNAHRGVMQARIIRRDDLLALFLAAAAGVLNDADLLVLRSLAAWLKNAERRKKRNSFLCLDCDAGFYEHQKPEAFLIVTPFAATSHAMVTGICRRCANCDDAALQSVIVKALRKRMYPDLTISAGPGRA
jgi:hypothetical protein